MRPIRIQGAEASAEDIRGRVLTHDLGPDLRKGTVLEERHLARIREQKEVHLMQLDPGDVHEDAAALHIGHALAGDGVEVTGPVQSQVRLLAARRGLLRVAAAAVDEANHVPWVSVFTVVDGQAVEKGDEVAGAKVIPVAVPAGVLEELDRVAARSAIVQVLPFKPLRTAIVVTERLKPKARELFGSAVRRKLGWYGAQLLWTREVARAGAPVRDAYQAAREAGAELVVFAGASSIDPLDAAYEELQAAGGKVLRVGAPSHPGSMLWLGRLAEAPVLGIASCAGFGKNTSLDLVLPFVFAYGRAEPEDFIRLGHGGLVEAGAGRRFPPYS
ncbi:MAG: hypothetical protein E6I08_15215 [Chloroflexi bacterium]|nr:MAG: hypothetical protein E6I08_15215 [Chloroflexota bacterium]